MASGSTEIGKIPHTVKFTGTVSSITSHRGKGLAITSSSVSIDGATAVSYSNAANELSKYYVVVTDIVSGHQHCLFERFMPNTTTGNIISLWNQSDSAQSPSFTITGYLIPKTMCGSF